MVEEKENARVSFVAGREKEEDEEKGRRECIRLTTRLHPLPGRKSMKVARGRAEARHLVLTQERCAISADPLLTGCEIVLRVLPPKAERDLEENRPFVLEPLDGYILPFFE